MSIFKRKIKNTFDVARDMGVDEEKIKELKEGERQVEGATMDKVLQSVNKSQVERDIEKLNIFEWYNNTDLKALEKKINQYDLNGNFIKTWNSQLEIQKELKIPQANISAAVRGVYKQTHGYRWEVANED